MHVLVRVDTYRNHANCSYRLASVQEYAYKGMFVRELTHLRKETERDGEWMGSGVGAEDLKQSISSCPDAGPPPVFGYYTRSHGL